MQPESHSIAKYTKIVAIIIMLGLVPALSFYIGTQYQSTVDIVSEAEVSPTPADYSEYEFPIQSATTFVSPELGISFEYNAAEWSIATRTAEEVFLKGRGEYADETIDFKKRRVPFTIVDAKFGPTSFDYDEGQGVWIIDEPESGLTGSDPAPRPAQEVFTTNSGIPVYPSTGRWKTYVLPIADRTMISTHITGSGITEPLDVITRSIKIVD